MDKYLKKTDVSATTEVSVAHTTFDLTAWAENLSGSQREHPSMMSANAKTQVEPMSTKTEETTSNMNLSSVSLLKSLSPGLKSDSKRSSIPVSSARKSVYSEQSSTYNSRADKVDQSFSAAAGSFTRTQTSHVVKQQENLHTSNSNRASLETQRSDHSSATLMMTSPDMKKGWVGLSSSKVTSPLAQSVRSGGQQLQDRENTSPEKKPLVRTINAPSLPSSSGERHFGMSELAVNKAAGKQN